MTLEFGKNLVNLVPSSYSDLSKLFRSLPHYVNIEIVASKELHKFCWAAGSCVSTSNKEGIRCCLAGSFRRWKIRQRQSTGEDLIERMQWFVNEDHSIQDRVPKPFEFEKEQEVIMGPIREVVIHIYSSETRDAGGIVEPKYSDDPGVRVCAKLKMDLRDLEVPIEKYNGIDLYVAKIDIEMTLDSASFSFCGIYGEGTSKEKRFGPKLVQFV